MPIHGGGGHLRTGAERVVKCCDERGVSCHDEIGVCVFVVWVLILEIRYIDGMHAWQHEPEYSNILSHDFDEPSCKRLAVCAGVEY